MIVDGEALGEVYGVESIDMRYEEWVGSRRNMGCSG